jgi:hypothetical protein
MYKVIVDCEEIQQQLPKIRGYLATINIQSAGKKNFDVTINCLFLQSQNKKLGINIPP